MVAMAVVVLVGAGNFVLGFALAIYFGHGPAELPILKKLLGKPQPHSQPH